ncbi:hypothetical protein H696_02896 [Fonticula alba]|uniref:Carboxylesterase type B domain-containing protein n=1 Tax=Fonticula alba TaxID=691883 RepID=A0A058Z8I1_FONAL|nr:hypothetical protein H696_02896 [Fonticula alba]KCV70550.1 hypothetical protein H696_02896 [Fonticula alba]|eukprot:XP_009495066.1 hypothetical protein H696_02896 [Fonticula alba]
MEEALAGQVAAMKHLPLDYPLSAFMPLLPTVDGVDLPDQPYNVVMAGRHHPVPVIMGTTADEVKLYIHMAWPNPVSAAEYRAAMRVLFKGNATEVLAEYPPVSGDNRSVMSVVGTHYVFSCPQRKFSRGLAAAGLAGPNSVFHYIHDQAWSFPGWEPNFSFCNGASCHGVDLPYYFNTATLMFDVTAPEQQLFRHIAGYFGNFVHTGNPNNGGGRGGSSPSSPATAWPGHSQTSDRYVVFTAPTPYSLSGYLQHECDFFDGIGYDPERVSRVANYLLSGIRA